MSAVTVSFLWSCLVLRSSDPDITLQEKTIFFLKWCLEHGHLYGRRKERRKQGKKEGRNKERKRKESLKSIICNTTQLASRLNSCLQEDLVLHIN